MKPSSNRRNLLVQITFVCLLIKLVDFQMVQTSISKLAAIKKSDTYSSLDSVSSGTSRQNVGQSRSSADGQVKTTVIQSNKPVRRRYKRQVTSGGQPQDLKRDTPQPQGTSDRAQISSGDPGSSVTWLDPQQQQQIVPAANPSFEAAFQGECSRNHSTNNPCDHICLDLHDGTYECSCFYGFALAVDGYSCTQLTNLADHNETGNPAAGDATAASASQAIPSQPQSADWRPTNGGQATMIGGVGIRVEEFLPHGQSESTTTAAPTPTTTNSHQPESPDASVELLMHGSAIGPPWPVENDSWQSQASHRPLARPKLSLTSKHRQPSDSMTLGSEEEGEDRKLNDEPRRAGRFELHELASGNGGGGGQSSRVQADDENTATGGIAYNTDDDEHDYDDEWGHSGGQRYYRRQQQQQQQQQDSGRANGHRRSDMDNSESEPESRRYENSLPTLAGQDEEEGDDDDNDDGDYDVKMPSGATTETKSTLSNRDGQTDERPGRDGFAYEGARPLVYDNTSARNHGRVLFGRVGARQLESTKSAATVKGRRHNRQRNDNSIDPKRWVGQTNNEQLENEDEQQQQEGDDEDDDGGDELRREMDHQEEPASDNLMSGRTRGADRWRPQEANTGRLAGDAGRQSGLEPVASDRHRNELAASGPGARGWRKNGSINRLTDAGPEQSQQDRLLSDATTSASRLNNDDDEDEAARNEIIGLDGVSYGGGDADDADDDDDVGNQDEPLEDLDEEAGGRQWRRRPVSDERRRRLDYDLGLLESLVGKTMDDFYQQKRQL